MSMKLDESVWSEEEEFEGETRESEVWGKGETVEGVSTKSISESLGEMCEVCWSGVSVGLKSTNTTFRTVLAHLSLRGDA